MTKLQIGYEVKMFFKVKNMLYNETINLSQLFFKVPGMIFLIDHVALGFYYFYTEKNILLTPKIYEPLSCCKRVTMAALAGMAQ